MSKRIPTQVVGDVNQKIDKEENHIQCLEKEFTESKEKEPEVEEKYISIKNAYEETNKEIADTEQTLRDRIGFLNRAVRAAENDQVRLHQDMADIKKEEEVQKQKYEAEAERINYEANDINTALKSKIQVALHQLRGLREFQERKHQLDQQMKAVKQLIEEERKQHYIELTDIHHQLIDQRQYYDHDLSVKLAAANEFARNFADLHVDLATSKIMKETHENRTALSKENTRSMDVLKKNEDLRKQIKTLEQRKIIFEGKDKKVSAESTELRANCEKLETDFIKIIDSNKEKIDQLREEMDERISELTDRLKIDREENERLKRQCAIETKNLQLAEESRFENFRKECDLLDSMNSAATFVLTSLEDKYKDQTENEEIAKSKSALNALIRKLAIIDAEINAKAKSRRLLHSSRDIAVQTDKPDPAMILSGKTQPPLTSRVGINPRIRTLKGLQDIKNMPQYKRLYGSMKAPVTKA